MSGWVGSTRRARLPKDWATLRAKVKARAHGRCEALAHVAGCDGMGTDCDHVVQGDDHRLSNLVWLSRPCHAAKTRTDNGSRALPRAAERHPGSIRGA